MTTAAKKAFGTKLYIGGSGTPNTGGTLIEEVTSIEPGEEAAKEVEVTSHDSTAAEYIASYIDSGSVAIEGNYTAAAGQVLLKANLGAAASNYYVNLAGGTGQKQLSFSAFCSKWQVQAALDGGIKYRATLRTTGAVTYNTQG